MADEDNHDLVSSMKLHLICLDFENSIYTGKEG
jgi:hypothetical protein